MLYLPNSKRSTLPYIPELIGHLNSLVYLSQNLNMSNDQNVVGSFKEERSHPMDEMGRDGRGHLSVGILGINMVHASCLGNF